MRYPVGDTFATELMLSLYEKLLDRRRPLPAALHLALGEALAADPVRPPLSSVTPILIGRRAADLQLAPPARPLEEIDLPQRGLSIGFPSEPARLVGRLQPMLRSSQALAPRSTMRGILFYGMPGGGKTTCALELAYGHGEGRFRGFVWYRVPEAGSEIASALYDFFLEIERQLNAPNLGLTAALSDPARLRTFILPRLRALLQQHSLLLALDNLETLLTDSNHWRDPLWGEVMAALLGHDGPSRLILTSRRCPADLATHPRLLAEPIHALSLAESVLLARELPNLGRLFQDEEGKKLLVEALRVIQGHPKLIELADALAADRARLAERVAAAADEVRDRGEVLDAFFAAGGEREGETRQGDGDFMAALRGWTAGVAGGLSGTANLLLAFLCRLEPEDRRQDIVEANWKDFLTRLGDGYPAAVTALAEPEEGVPAALAALAGAGLVAVDRPEIDAVQVEGLQEALAAQGVPADASDPGALLAALASQVTTYAIHPGVAEATRAATAPALLAAADIELGNYHIAMVQRGLETEMAGGGGIVVASARRGAPYLLRQARWQEASTLLEQMLQRDSSPAALAFALPLLRQIVAATADTERSLGDVGVLAKTLRKAGCMAEAEAIDRVRIQEGIAQGNYRLASAAAGQLVNLLRINGRLDEALAMAGEKAGYTRRAGLGPWTQLGDEGKRLQILTAMGRYDEVLAAVEALRPRMDALPLQRGTEEAIDPWSVREGLLDTGREAAMRSKRWEQALALNAETVKEMQARGADTLQLMRTRLNDSLPLLNLHRYGNARALLLACRTAFDDARDIARSSAPRPTWRIRPATAPRPCASRRSPWRTHTGTVSPISAPSATTTWPAACSARGARRWQASPTAWPRRPSGCRCGRGCCLPP
jgi:DNA polymerase III delta prime subunit